MTTTLTLDDEVAGLLKERARERGASFNETVNRTLRAGLDEAAMRSTAPIPGTIPHSFGSRTGRDLDKLNQLAGELEADCLWSR